MRKILSAIVLMGLVAFNGHAQKVCAHRGMWQCEEAGYAQNSIAALRLAQENGVWGSEFDVQLTADSIAVVNHDPSFKKLLISGSTYKELLRYRLPNGETIPTLNEYLHQGMLSSCVLVLEIKPQSTVEATLYLTELCVKELRAHDLLDPSRVVFISFSYDACKWIGANLPAFQNQYLQSDLEPEAVWADGINGIDYNWMALRAHPEWVERAHALGMFVNVWTVDEPAQIAYMRKLGVDVITTNTPLDSSLY